MFRPQARQFRWTTDKRWTISSFTWGLLAGETDLWVEEINLCIGQQLHHDIPINTSAGGVMGGGGGGGKAAGHRSTEILYFETRAMDESASFEAI